MVIFRNRCFTVACLGEVEKTNLTCLGIFPALDPAKIMAGFALVRETLNQFHFGCIHFFIKDNHKLTCLYKY